MGTSIVSLGLVWGPAKAGVVARVITASRLKLALVVTFVVQVTTTLELERTSRIVAMSFCEPRSWTRVLSS